ncbi:MAG: hypothetical protein ACOCU8_02485 [Patescibacteria group bacterium]
MFKIISSIIFLLILSTGSAYAKTTDTTPNINSITEQKREMTSDRSQMREEIKNRLNETTSAKDRQEMANRFRLEALNKKQEAIFTNLEQIINRLQEVKNRLAILAEKAGQATKAEDNLTAVDDLIQMAETNKNKNQKEIKIYLEEEDWENSLEALKLGIKNIRMDLVETRRLLSQSIASIRQNL